MNIRNLAFLLFLGLLAFAPHASLAANCSSPTGSEGQMRYDSTAKAMYFCNGTSWTQLVTSVPTWTTVPLTDTNYFDSNCLYRFKVSGWGGTTENDNGFLYATYVQNTNTPSAFSIPHPEMECSTGTGCGASPHGSRLYGFTQNQNNTATQFISWAYHIEYWDKTSVAYTYARIPALTGYDTETYGTVVLIQKLCM